MTIAGKGCPDSADTGGEFAKEISQGKTITIYF